MIKPMALKTCDDCGKDFIPHPYFLEFVSKHTNGQGRLFPIIRCESCTLNVFEFQGEAALFAEKHCEDYKLSWNVILFESLCVE